MHPIGYVAICCLWLLGGLGILWLALRKMRFSLAQAFFVAAGLCSAAAGLCNGLVIVANGIRMPVEYVDWRFAPTFLDAPEDRASLLCRIIVTTDDAVMPSSNGNLHVDVAPPPRVVHGAIAKRIASPRLAFLDDRHGIRICGQSTTYSKGDALGALGVAHLFAGTLALILAFLWRRLRRRTKIPT